MVSSFCVTNGGLAFAGPVDAGLRRRIFVRWILLQGLDPDYGFVAPAGGSRCASGRTTVTVQGASAATRAETEPMKRRRLPLPRAPMTMWSTCRAAA